MPIYTLSGKVTVSASTTVEADSPEEAKEIASLRGAWLECYGTDETEDWVIGGVDGEVVEIEVDDA